MTTIVERLRKTPAHRYLRGSGDLMMEAAQIIEDVAIINGEFAKLGRVILANAGPKDDLIVLFGGADGDMHAASLDLFRACIAIQLKIGAAE